MKLLFVCIHAAHPCTHSIHRSDIHVDILKNTTPWSSRDGVARRCCVPNCSSCGRAQSLEGVTSFYTVFVYQFGWVALFASVFPLMPVIALVCNLVELRTDAWALLTQTKRPRYMCATDIGAWQTVMNVLATLAILTNSLLVGLTSHSLYFYLPDLTEVERLWCVAILEHVLFLLKLLVENFLPPDTQEDREAYERQQYLANASVEVWLKPTGGADDD